MFADKRLDLDCILILVKTSLQRTSIEGVTHLYGKGQAPILAVSQSKAEPCYLGNLFGHIKCIKGSFGCSRGPCAHKLREH